MLETKPKGKRAAHKIYADDMVMIYGTGTGLHLAKGVKLSVHKIAAENLVAKGVASYDEIEKEPAKEVGKVTSKKAATKGKGD